MVEGSDLEARHGHQAVPQGDDTQTVSARPGATPVRADAAADGIHSRGAVFGRYRVLSLLGQGGMGNIYAAYDPQLDRKVALKVLRREALGRQQGEAAQLRLIREARAIAKLNHPNAVRVYDVGAVGEQVFVTMELIEGVTLAQWQEIEPRPWREILRIFLEAGKGLEAAHAAGLVHRDFKPGNVMVTPDGRVLVLDFGLARAAMGAETPDSKEEIEDEDEDEDEDEESPWSPAVNTPITLTGEALGTPAYMAPEQFRGAGADARADQFSFCVALYKALHGELPFKGDTLPELRRAIEKGEVREPPARTRVPSWVRRALMRGLHADPEARYVDLEDLLAILEHQPLVRRRRWLGAAALLLGLIAALVTGLQWSARKRSLLCQGAERKLAGVWDAGRKDVLRQTFLTSGLPYAESTWTRIEDRLDGYAAAWVTTHTESCEATWLRGEQSAEMLDLQMACLDKRLRELWITTDLLAGADQQIIRNAIPVASGLPAVAACVDREALASAPRRDPETEARADQIRERFFEVKALDLAGKYAEGLALAREAADMAENLSDQPLLAEARLRLAGMSGRMARVEEMKENLLASVDLAQASHADTVLAQAQIYMILASYMGGEPEHSDLWARLANSAIARLGGNSGLEADRRFFLGMVANMNQQYQEAIEHFQAAVDNFTARSSNKPVHVYNNLGNAYYGLGRLEEAGAAYRQVLEETEGTYGPEHPAMVAPLLQLGDVRHEQGQPDDAMGHYRRALEICERTQEIWSCSSALTDLGQILIELGKPAEALAHLERGVATLEAQDRDPATLADSRFQLAQALRLSGKDLPRARRLAVAARDTFAELGERTVGDLKRVDAWLAEPPGTP